MSTTEYTLYAHILSSQLYNTLCKTAHQQKMASNRQHFKDDDVLVIDKTYDETYDESSSKPGDEEGGYGCTDERTDGCTREEYRTMLAKERKQRKAEDNVGLNKPKKAKQAKQLTDNEILTQLVKNVATDMKDEWPNCLGALKQFAFK